jgi:hypothetical protein
MLGGGGRAIASHARPLGSVAETGQSAGADARAAYVIVCGLR